MSTEVSEGAFSIQPSSEWTFDVGDPTKVGSGMSAHTNYTVSFKHGEQENSVQRRYSDFTWLRDALRDNFIGCIVPPIPAEGAKNKAVALLAKTGKAEKVAGGTRVAAFFNKRQGGMQLFLSRVAAHGELSNSEMFNKFLTEFALDGYKKQLKEAENARRGSTMNRVGHWFGKKKQQLAESSTGQKVAAKAGKEIPERNMSADDEAFAALHTTLKQFKDPADRLKTRAGSLPAHGEAMGDSYANLSKAMTECSSIPTMDGIAKWSSTFDVLSAQSESLYQQFQRRSEDMSGLVGAGLAACKMREDKRLSVKSATDSLTKAKGKGDATTPEAMEEHEGKLGVANERFVQAHTRCMRDCKVLIEGFSAEYSSVIQEFISIQQQMSAERAEACKLVLEGAASGAAGGEDNKELAL